MSSSGKVSTPWPLTVAHYRCGRVIERIGRPQVWPDFVNQVGCAQQRMHAGSLGRSPNIQSDLISGHSLDISILRHVHTLFVSVMLLWSDKLACFNTGLNCEFDVEKNDCLSL